MKELKLISYSLFIYFSINILLIVLLICNNNFNFQELSKELSEFHTVEIVDMLAKKTLPLLFKTSFYIYLFLIFLIIVSRMVGYFSYTENKEAFINKIKFLKSKLSKRLKTR